jgi:PAS domain S-box-containing protein
VAASPRDPRLVLRFAVYGGVALLLAIGVGVLFARANANARATDQASRDAGFLADRLARDDVARTAFLAPATGSERALLDDFLNLQDLGPGVVRVTLFSTDGRVTYSSDHTLIGRKLDAAQVGRAFGGHTVTGRSSVQTKRMLESFLPIYWVMDPSRPRGVLAVDRDYAPVAAEIHDDFLFEAGAITLALLILYVAMLPVMHRMTTMLEERARRLQQELAERQRLARIVESSNDAIVGRDRDGVIISWNDAAERVYGWKRQEIVGRQIDVLLPPSRDERPESEDELELSRTVHVRRDGTPVRVSVTISPIRDERGALFGSSMIARDITAVVELENELREAQKQETLGRFATAIANDLEALVDEIVPTDAAARGLELLRQLQSFGRREELETERVDVNDLLTGLKLKLALRLGSQIDLVLEPESQRAAVVADPRLLERVVLDLALSAREAMPDGGRITIATGDVDFARRREERDADGNVHLDAGHYVMLSVTDSGTKHHAERLGLGLATVFALAEQNGGTVGVETHPGEGTTVRVYLPRAEAAAAELVA